MPLSQGDQNIVRNLRSQYLQVELEKYSDEAIALAWRQFSLSNEYQDLNAKPELFLDWCQMAQDGEL